MPQFRTMTLFLRRRADLFQDGRGKNTTDGSRKNDRQVFAFRLVQQPGPVCVYHTSRGTSLTQPATGLLKCYRCPHWRTFGNRTRQGGKAAAASFSFSLRHVKYRKEYVPSCPPSNKHETSTFRHGESFSQNQSGDIFAVASQESSWANRTALEQG